MSQEKLDKNKELDQKQANQYALRFHQSKEMVKRPEAYITNNRGKQCFVLNGHTKTLTIFPLQNGDAFINFNRMTAATDNDGNPVWDQLTMIMPIATIKQYAKLLVDNL